MSESLPDLTARIRLDTTQLEGAVGKATKVGSAIGSAMGNLAAHGIEAGLGAITDFVGGAISAARESAAIGRATEQLIRTTGSAARVTADQVGDMAGRLSNLTGVDDELIQQGANLLLTFKNVANAGAGVDAVFDRATAAAVDLSAAGFGSVESASTMLGKALNDPIAGLTALGRAGVTFSDQQKEQIKNMVEQGDLLGAQKAILKEVEGQVGGVAAATADPLDRAKVAIGNLQEQIGGYMLPVLGMLATWLVDRVLPGIGRVADAIGQRLAPVFDQLGAIIGPVVQRVGDALQGLFDLFARGDLTGQLTSALGVAEDSPLIDFLFDARDAVLGLVGTFRGMAGQVLPVLQGIAAQLLPVAQGVAAQLLPALQSAGRAIIGVLLPALGSLAATFVSNVLPVVRSVAGFFLGSVVPVLTTIARIVLGTVVPAVAGFVAILAAKLRPIIAAVSAFIVGTLVPALAKFMGRVQEAVVAAQPFISFLVQLIGWVLRVVGTIAGVLIPIFLKVAGPVLRAVFGALGGLIGIIGSVLGWIGRFGSALMNAGSYMDRMRTAIIIAGARVLSWFRGLPGQIAGALGSLGSRLYNAGGDLLQGLINGIKNKVSAAVRAVKDAVGSVVSGAKRLLGIASPSKVFDREVGQQIGAGLAQGIRRATGAVSAAAGDMMGTVTGAVSTMPPVRIATSAGAAAAQALTGAAQVAAAGARGAGDRLLKPEVRVFLGDTELRDLVRVEVVGWAEDEARSVELGAV